MRKRRSDRNHAIYVITNIVTNEQYIGLTAINPNGVKQSIRRRIQKHVQRASIEDKDWGLCNSIRKYKPENFTFGLLEIVRGKAQAHKRELEYIREYNPILNTFK